MSGGARRWRGVICGGEGVSVPEGRNVYRRPEKKCIKLQRSEMIGTCQPYLVSRNSRRRAFRPAAANFRARCFAINIASLRDWNWRAFAIGNWATKAGCLGRSQIQKFSIAKFHKRGLNMEQHRLAYETTKFFDSLTARMPRGSNQCSAGFQPAVSRISNPLASRSSNGLPTGSR